MRYQPVEPINQPDLQDQLLGVKREDQIIGNVDFLDEVESVVCTNVDAPYGVKLALRRSHTFYRLSERPIKLRHNGATIDFELYCDCYNFVQEEEHYVGQGERYPGIEVYERDWGSNSYYRRDTSCYIFEGVEVPERSSYIWDGRHPVAVNSKKELVDSSSRIDLIQKAARLAIKKPLTPKHTFPLGNSSITRQPKNYPKTIHTDKYDLAIQSFLDLHYNANSITSVPLSTVGLMSLVVEYNGPPLLNNEELESIVQVAALLNENYFVQWVSYNTFVKRVKTVNA